MFKRVVVLLAALAIVLTASVLAAPRPTPQASCQFVFSLFNQPIRVCSSGGGSGGSW